MTLFVASITKILSVLTLVGDAVILIVILAILMKKSGWARPILNCFKNQAMLIAFMVVLGGFLGSLFYSEVAGFAPCLLCWWQRIFLYPQVILFGLALWKKDGNVWNYSLVLSGLGGAIALYHTYIQFGGSPLVPCSASGIAVSCAQRYFLEFGYVTIPTMALTSFLLLIVLALTAKFGNKSVD